MPTIKTLKGALKFKTRMLYLGIKQINRDVAFDNLKTVSEILDKGKIHWGPVLGTLLGIVRENNFIEWDEDIDLYILQEEEEAFKNLLWDLKDAGFDIVRYERRGLYSIMRNGEYIDFYVLRKITPDLRHLGGGEFIFEKYLVDTTKFNFKGLLIDIPSEYDELLTFLYGDWRIPRKWANFEMSAFQKFKMKSKSWIKNHLPDSLYFYLIEQYHAKDLEKFKIKCAERGILIPSELSLKYR